MRYLSLFSGVEACTVAWKPLGWEAAAFCEWDAAPSAVLAHHYPDVPNFGDVSNITADDIRSLGHIDLVVGGSPCQAFSIAGLRKGLEDPRGNMTLEFVRVVELVKPQFVVWENVPGVLTEKTGALQCLLDALGLMGYSVDLQQLCASEFNLAQRRKRVFLVATLGLKKTLNTLWKTTVSSGQLKSPRTSVGLEEQFRKKLSLSESHNQALSGAPQTLSSCATTILENLGKLSLITLGELSAQSQSMPKDSVLQDVRCHIVPQMMNLLGMPSDGLKNPTTWTRFWNPLLHALGDHLQQYQADYVSSDSHYATQTESEVQPLTDERMCVGMGSESWNIVHLLQNLLGEIYKVVSASTTSTLTKQTIALRTYSFVTTVASIREYMVNLKSWPEALFVQDSLFLTMIDESTSYATKKNVKRFIKDNQPSMSDHPSAPNKTGTALLDTGDWTSRPPILLERESLRGDTPPSRETQKETPTDVEAGVAVPDTSACFTASSHAGYKQGVGTLRASGGDLGGGSENLLVAGIDYENNGFTPDQPMGPLMAGSPTGGGRPLPAVAYAIKATAIGRKPENGGNGLGVSEEVSDTLTTVDRHGVGYRMAAFGQYEDDQTASTMKQRDYKDATDLVVTPPHYAVRRLTPVECCRLQGFPDDYLDVEYRGKPFADGNKYKAMGNSMAVPVMRWIAESVRDSLAHSDQPS